MRKAQRNSAGCPFEKYKYAQRPSKNAADGKALPNGHPAWRFRDGPWYEIIDIEHIRCRAPIVPVMRGDYFLLNHDLYMLTETLAERVHRAV